MSTTFTEAAVVRAIADAVATVDDPEYPGISIADLGLVERIDFDRGTARVGLIPTFSGCPALDIIAGDVRRAVAAIEFVTEVDVMWMRSPVWNVDRVSDSARQVLADQFTVAVKIGRSEPACPRCGTSTQPESMFGPSRCRSVSTCPACHEAVEVLRA